MKLCDTNETKEIENLIEDLLPLFNYDKFDKFFDPPCNTGARDWKYNNDYVLFLNLICLTNGWEILKHLPQDKCDGTWQYSREKFLELQAKGYARISTQTKKMQQSVICLRNGKKRVEDGEIEVVGRAEDESLMFNDDNYEQRYIPGNQWWITSHDATEFSSNFAGSGTTLHAINLLNAEDGGVSSSVRYWSTPNQTSNPAADLALPKGNSTQYMDTFIIPDPSVVIKK